MEKIEMLMRPRVIVENKWPGCQFEVGDILIQDGDYYWVMGDVSWHGKIPKAEIEPFPYLMRPLQWWEDRAPEDMPEYVKQTGMVNSKGETVPDTCIKVKKHFASNSGDWRDNKFSCFAPDLEYISTIGYVGYEPATEQDYLSYTSREK